MGEFRETGRPRWGPGHPTLKHPPPHCGARRGHAVWGRDRGRGAWRPPPSPGSTDEPGHLGGSRVPPAADAGLPSAVTAHRGQHAQRRRADRGGATSPRPGPGVGHGTLFRLMMIKGKPMGLQRKVSSPPRPARLSPRATPRASVWPPVPPLEPAPPVLGWMLCPLISSPPGTSGRGLAWSRAFVDVVTRRQGPPGRGEH